MEIHLCDLSESASACRTVEVTGARNLRLEFSSSNFFQKFLLEREMVFA
jgi:hypothetical protein